MSKYYVKKDLDLKLYLHGRDEEFWLPLLEFPAEVASFDLRIRDEQEMVLVYVSIMEKETTLLSTDNHNCGNYNQKSFISCCKRSFIVSVFPPWHHS